MGFLTHADARLVESVFRKYYLEKAHQVFVPERIGEREFGYFPFEEKGMIRHLQIDSAEKLVEFLKRSVPLHVYHSAAFYMYPAAMMEEKGWMGAELVFDIDADHLDPACGRRHDFKVCPKCFSTYSTEPDKCGGCGERLSEVDWVCSLCLEAARNEVEKLLDFLEADLGFRKIRLAFSGNRGFHVVVTDEDVLELGQRERKEIVDYVTGTGISLRAMGLVEDVRRDRLAGSGGPSLTDPGWRGRIARSAAYLAVKADIEELAELSGEYRLARRYGGLSGLISDEWMDRAAWDTLPRGMVKLLGKAAVRHASARIDTVVTSDIHRLIRLGNTLNGKSGLLAKVISREELDSLDPFTDAVALPRDEEIEVYVLKSPKFTMDGRDYGPYEKVKVVLPLPVAVLLVAKNAATVSRLTGEQPG